MAFKWDDLKAEIARQEKRETERQNEQRAERQAQQNVQQHIDREDDENVDVKDQELLEDEELRLLEQIRQDLDKVRTLTVEAWNEFEKIKTDSNSLSTEPEQIKGRHERLAAVLDKFQAAFKLKQSVVARQIEYHKRKRSRTLSMVWSILRAPPEDCSSRTRFQVVGHFARGELSFARWKIRRTITMRLANRLLHIGVRLAKRMGPM